MYITIINMIVMHINPQLRFDMYISFKLKLYIMKTFSFLISMMSRSGRSLVSIISTEQFPNRSQAEVYAKLNDVELL